MNHGIADVAVRRGLLGAALLAGTTLLAMSSVAHAADAAAICESSKLGTSAKYAQCRLKADAKAAKSGTTADYTKCTLARFGSAEDKAGAGICPSEGDQASIGEFMDACTDSVTAALGGDALPLNVTDCNADLGTCTSDLSVAESSLTTCTSDLSVAESNLTTCTDDLASTDADLTACGGELVSCESRLGVLKTGQTASFGAGSDGDIQLGVAPSYTDNGDGTITDNVTGLMWEKKSDDGSIHDKDNLYSWSVSIPPHPMDGTMVTTFLAALNAGGGFAGYNDWRIPTVRELHTLANYEGDSPAVFPAFDGSCTDGCTVTSCSCTSPNFYWSTTTQLPGGNQAWIVEFFFGTVSYNGKMNSAYVRAVRSAS